MRKIGGGLCVRSHPGIGLELGSDSKSDEMRRSGLPQLTIETLTLATELPSRYLFYPTPDPPLRSRCSALRVNWGMLELGDCQVLPTSN